MPPSRTKPRGRITPNAFSQPFRSLALIVGDPGRAALPPPSAFCHQATPAASTHRNLRPRSPSTRRREHVTSGATVSLPPRRSARPARAFSPLIRSRDCRSAHQHPRSPVPPPGHRPRSQHAARSPSHGNRDRGPHAPPAALHRLRPPLARQRPLPFPSRSTDWTRVPTTPFNCTRAAVTTVGPPSPARPCSGTTTASPAGG